MAYLLLQENCTVTIAHSKTEGLPRFAERQILLSPRPDRAELVRGDWIKPGAIVIDVGINRIPAEDGKTRLVGDVAYAEVVRDAPPR